MGSDIRQFFYQASREFQSNMLETNDMYIHTGYSNGPIEKEIRILSIRIKILISAFHSLVRNS